MHGIDKANRQRRSDSPERRHVRRVAAEQDVDQHHQGHGGRPSLSDDREQQGNFFGRQALEAQALGLEMDHAQDADVVHGSGYGGGDDDGGIGNLEELGHHEGGGTHDRRGDLTAGAGRGLDAAGEMTGVAHAFHVGNGQRAGGDHVGDGGPGNGAEER